MGLGRFIIKTLNPTYTIFSVTKKIVENGLVDGVKEEMKEFICEDHPVTSYVYKEGIYDGKKEGYANASDEYEKKLLKQADEFLKQSRIFESQKDGYEQLLDELENEIDELSEKINRTREENEYLQQLIMKDRKLRKMAY